MDVDRDIALRGQQSSFPGETPLEGEGRVCGRGVRHGRPPVRIRVPGLSVPAWCVPLGPAVWPGVQVSPPANGVTGPRACVPGGPRPAFPEALQELLTARGSHAPPARLPFFIQLVFQFVSEANVRGATLHWPEKEEALPRAHESSGRGSGCPGAWCQSRAWTSAMGHCTQMDRQARCSRQVAAWEVVTPMG